MNGPQNGETNKAWWRMPFLTLLFLISAIGLSNNIYDIRQTLGLSPITEVARSLTDTTENPSSGWRTVLKIAPGSALDRAGIRDGDRILPHNPYIRLRRAVPGEQRSFTVERNGVRSNITITYATATLSKAEQERLQITLFWTLGNLICFAFGLLIMWRGWRNNGALLLAGWLIARSGGGGIPYWATGPYLEIPIGALGIAGNLVNLTLPAFCMLATGRSFKSAFGGLVMAAMAVQGCQILYELIIYLRGYGASNFYYSWAWTGLGVTLATSMMILWVGRKNASPEKRAQLNLILLGTAAFLVAGIVFYMLKSRVMIVSGTVTPLDWFTLVCQRILMPALFAYAILRHKLIDLGFAINRTLVYGVVSFLMLAAFGLGEWAIKHLIPKVWMESSAFISAGIAVGLFLIVHRVRDAVEEMIERLFFREWHQAEAQLRKFVNTAPHYEQADVLCDGLVKELGRFGGAEAALYIRQDKKFALAAGPGSLWPESFDGDDPLFAHMRMDRAPVAPDDAGSAIKAALAAPMIDNNALAGFILLAAKPDGEGYRSDQVELVGWATQKVGHTLQVLRLHEIETRMAELTKQNQKLSDLLVKALGKKAVPA
jgi:hypothetical protein